jgi:hypothetical protein
MDRVISWGRVRGLLSLILSAKQHETHGRYNKNNDRGSEKVIISAHALARLLEFRTWRLALHCRLGYPGCDDAIEKPYSKQRPVLYFSGEGIGVAGQ